MLALALAYAAVCAGAYFAQGRLLFHPSPDRGPPAAYGLADYERVTFETSDGLTLTGWLRDSGRRDKAIVYFYGNGDSLAGSPALLRRLADDGFTVLGVNYRGYGGSQGAPSEAGLYRDADAALAFLSRYAPAERTVVLGRSLGAAVAVELASRNRIAGLVLVSPFTSVPDVGAGVYWFLPVRLLSRFAFASIDKIGRVEAPLLVIHGGADTLIPVGQGRRLLDAAKGRKRLVIFEGEGHNDLDLRRLGAEVADFASGL